MSSKSSWRPNVTESQLFDDTTFLQGATLSTVVYGVNLALFTQIASLLITRLKVDIRDNGRASRQTIYLMTYVCVMFVLSTLAVSSQAEMTQLSFVENRDFPGGPGAYQQEMFSSPISNLGNCCLCLMNWFSDSLLLWRCWVVYTDSRISIWLVMAIPKLMLLASFVTGTLFLQSISLPSSSPWAKTASIFNFIYFIVTLSLNIVLNNMIIIRLYIHRRRITKLFGRRYAAHYTSIISMIIESQAVPFVVALWFLITFIMHNRLANIPLLSMTQVQCAASYMIIFRVAKGTAWTSQTAYTQFTIQDIPVERLETLPNIRYQTGPARHPSASLATRNQFPLDEPRDMLDRESNSSVSERSPRDPPGIIQVN